MEKKGRRSLLGYVAVSPRSETEVRAFLAGIRGEFHDEAQLLQITQHMQGRDKGGQANGWADREGIGCFGRPVTHYWVELGIVMDDCEGRARK